MAPNDADSCNRTDLPAYPYYNRPYRGLPCQIRMRIWRLCLCGDLHVKSALVDRESQAGLSGSSIAFGSWGKNLVDSSSFNFAVFLLNRETHAEAMQVGKGVKWIFPNIESSSLQGLLSTFSPFQKRITCAINVHAESIQTHCQCILGDRPSPLLACDHNVELLPVILATSELDHLSELTIRVSFQWTDAIMHFAIATGLPLNVAPPGTPVALVRNFLVMQFRVRIWVNTVAQAVYNFLIRGEISVIKFLLTDIVGEGKEHFAQPAETVFAYDIWLMYLTPSQVAELKIQVQWVAETDDLLVTLTKKT